MRAITFCLSLLLCASAQASFSIVGTPRSTVDSAAGQVNFSLTFNETPDFFTKDSHGRQADSFQYFLNVDPPSPDESNLVLLRGDSISGTGKIGVSDNYGPDRNWLSYKIVNNTMTFSAPISMLHDDDGNFWYHVELYQYGGMTCCSAVVQSGHVPVPGALLLAGIGAMASAWLRKRKAI
jgi:hypothetical protein